MKSETTESAFLRGLVNRAKLVPGPEWAGDRWSLTLTPEELRRLEDVAHYIDSMEK